MFLKEHTTLSEILLRAECVSHFSLRMKLLARGADADD